MHPDARQAGRGQGLPDVRPGLYDGQGAAGAGEGPGRPVQRAHRVGTGEIRLAQVQQGVFSGLAGVGHVLGEGFGEQPGVGGVDRASGLQDADAAEPRAVLVHGLQEQRGRAAGADAGGGRLTVFHG